MKRKLLSMLAASSAALAFAAPADAAYLQYNLTGDYTAEWFIDLPETFYVDEASTGSGIGFYDVDGTFPTSSPIFYADVRFYNTAVGGGFTLVDHYNNPPGDILLLTALGPQLYTGDEQGNFKLINSGTFNFTGGTAAAPLNYTLSISQIGVVPEPMTWAMMIGGFGLIGGTLRARANRVAFA